MTKPHICLDDCIKSCRFGDFAFGMRRREIANVIGASNEPTYPDYVAYGNVAFDIGLKWDALFTVMIALPFHDLAGLIPLESWSAGFDSRFAWDVGKIFPGMTTLNVREAFPELVFREPDECIPEYPIQASLNHGTCDLHFWCPPGYHEPTLQFIVLWRPYPS